MCAQGRPPNALASRSRDAELPMQSVSSWRGVRQEGAGMMDDDNEDPANQADEPGPSHVTGPQESMDADPVTPAPALPADQAGPSQVLKATLSGVITIASDEEDDPANRIDRKSAGQAAAFGEACFTLAAIHQFPQDGFGCLIANVL